MSEEMKKIEIVDFGTKKKVKKVKEEKVAEKGAVVQQSEQRNFESEYEFLKERIITQLKQNHSDLADQKKIGLKQPKVIKDGKKKTTWTNFGETCQQMKRDQVHFSQFVIQETGSDCLVQQAAQVESSENQQGVDKDKSHLIIKGNFQVKSIEQFIKKYMQEYVTCQLCKSHNTVLVRDNNTRLFEMKCLNCNATRTVSTITKKKQ